MTNAEYQAIRNAYITLLEKKNRTVIEDAKYGYLDKVITYVELIKTAKSMGNKNPQDNCMVKEAKKRMDNALLNYRSVVATNS